MTKTLHVFVVNHLVTLFVTGTVDIHFITISFCETVYVIFWSVRVKHPHSFGMAVWSRHLTILEKLDTIEIREKILCCSWTPLSRVHSEEILAALRFRDVRDCASDMKSKATKIKNQIPLIIDVCNYFRETQKPTGYTSSKKPSVQFMANMCSADSAFTTPRKHTDLLKALFVFLSWLLRVIDEVSYSALEPQSEDTKAERRAQPFKGCSGMAGRP